MDRKIFFDKIRVALFHRSMTQQQVDGITAILEAWDQTGFSDSRWLSYCLATAYHETAATMWPVEEYGKGKGRAYGVPAGPWHEVYDGRGDVQVTWEANYVKASAKLRAHGIVVDLDQHPEQAMVPATAAAILLYGMAEGWFTGSTLGHWFSATTTDAVGARRIVNGNDRAALIATYYSAIMPCVIAAKVAAVQAAMPSAPKSVPASVKPVALPSVITPAPKPPLTAWQRFWAALFHKAA